MMARQPAAIQLRYLQTLVEIGSEKNTTVVFPLPIDILSSLGQVLKKLAGPELAGSSRQAKRNPLMPKNEDGEFELILGNRQLLSVFFIVVVLLGVFFTMGYIVGRNSLLATAVAAPRRPRPKPIVVDRRRSGSSRESAPAAQRRRRPLRMRRRKPSEPEKPNSRATEGSREDESAEPRPSRPQRHSRAPAGRITAREPASAGPDLSAARRDHAARGRHRWSTCCARRDSSAIARRFRSKAGTFRVLVGPLTGRATEQDAKPICRRAGFPGDRAIRRTFCDAAIWFRLELRGPRIARVGAQERTHFESLHV